MSAAAPFPISGAASGGAHDFVRAVARRFTGRGLAVALAVLVAFVLLAGYGLVTPAWGAPWPARGSRFVNTAVAGVLMIVAVAAADEAVERGLPRLPTYGVAVVGAAVIGTLAGWHLRLALGLTYHASSEQLLSMNASFGLVRRLDMMMICTLVGALATFVHVNRRTSLAARRRQHEAERARAQAQRRTLESQLQALQARVEPMFLFGTLERIRQLYRTDAAAASSMLEDLIAYLRAALPHLRESTSTVSQELMLARAWLDIMGRTAQPWRVAFDVAEVAREARLPALVLLPLVQHAVTGEGPTPLDLHVVVQVQDEPLRIEVRTSTDAFEAGIDDQPLLEQLRDRLDKLFKEDARFEMHGNVAVIELPHDKPSEGPA